jgi:copper transport protein
MLIVGLMAVHTASAHATLVRSDPPANSVLPAPPADIRLWFTEALEPDYSHVTLRDIHSQPLDTLPSQVDPTDSKQMFLKPGKLPEGLYTVAWQTVSKVDGHALHGSFPFTVGPAVAGQAAVTVSPDLIPQTSSLVRWLNLLSLALVVGGVGFVLFVWKPAAFARQPNLERRLNGLIAVGWTLTGITSVLMLLLQVSTAVRVSLIGALSSPALRQIVTHTHFGSLWMARMALWLLLGGVLVRAIVRDSQHLYWTALALGGAILLTGSLYSHAAAAQDATASIFADWLHLSLAAVWIGGLVQFLNVIGPVWRSQPLGVPAVTKLVGYFSNFARVAVAGLLVTGLYAAWLQVESLDGLLTTLYGQILIVKLILIMPLLGIAGVNLLFTQRALRAGKSVWVGRLRGLVGLEAALTMAILGAVGVLTSLNTPRNDLMQRAAMGAPAPFSAGQSVNGVRVQMSISPGTVGQNTFTVALQDAQGTPITDASLIRLRFDDQTQNVGESELRITQGEQGVYSVSGSNLSLPGAWRIRTMIERPDHYDTVLDFKPSVKSASPWATVDPNAPLPHHIPALLVAGVVAFGLGGFFVSQSRFPSGAGVLSCGLLVLGGVFLVSVAADATSGADAIATHSTQAAASAAVSDCIPDPGGDAVSPSPHAGALRILSPADGASLQGNPLILQIATDKLEQSNLWTYVDGNLTSRNRGTLIALTELSPGSHQICVVAVDSSSPGHVLAEDGIHIVIQAVPDGQ